MPKIRNIAESVPQVLAENITWWAIHDYIGERRCKEARQFGKCNCRKSRMVKTLNHCELETAIMDEIYALAIGEPFPGVIPIDTILRWFQYRTCKSHPNCQHKGCWSAAEYVNFVGDRLESDIAAHLRKQAQRAIITVRPNTKASSAVSSDP